MPPAAKPRVLDLPKQQPAHFVRNFIRLAVCELRFPTLLEVETGSPTAFQKAIRHEYPLYERGTDINLNPGTVSGSITHRFRSKSGKWTVAFRQSSLTLETDAYDSFEDFSKRLRFVVSAAAKTMDTDFYTRVGLRYVNGIGVSQEDLSGWVNDDLVRPLVQGVFGTVDQTLQEVRGKTNLGGYTLRHGVALSQTSGKQEYLLDFDFFAEDVQTSKLDKTLTGLHLLEYDLFAWTLGAKAKAHLGASTVKKGE